MSSHLHLFVDNQDKYVLIMESWGRRSLAAETGVEIEEGDDLSPQEVGAIYAIASSKAEHYNRLMQPQDENWGDYYDCFKAWENLHQICRIYVELMEIGVKVCMTMY